MRNLIYFVAILMLPSLGWAQATWLDPADAAADDTVRLYVDLTLTSNDNGIVEAAAGGEDMYIWTWKPAEHPEGHPLVNGLGSQAWKSSNPALKMTKESEGVYYYEMVPTEFYEVDANTVYAEDFHFLVKPLDGGGFGDPDTKTEDLLIKIDPAGCDPRSVGTMPDVINADNVLPVDGNEVLTLVYDNSLEVKASMQNLTVMDTLFVYARGTSSDGGALSVSSRNGVSDNPALQMTRRDDGTYYFYCIPNELYKDVLSVGATVKELRWQILKKDARTSNDLVDGEFIYILQD